MSKELDKDLELDEEEIDTSGTDDSGETGQDTDGDNSDVDVDLEDDDSDGALDDIDDVEDPVEDSEEDAPEPSPKKSKEDSSIIAQKKKWRERALKAERELSEKQGALVNPSQKTRTRKEQSQHDAMLINFRLDNPTLKSKEVSEIEAYARAKGISLEGALKSDVIRIMIARNRKMQQQQGGSVNPSRRGQPTKPEKDWSRASRQEMEAEVARRRALAAQGRT